MARIELAAEITDDFERILEHLAAWQVEHPERRIREIVSSIDILALSPQIGRPGHGGKRELVIGQGSRGYVALYHYAPEIDTVFVLAIRSQREAGYARE